MNSVGLDYQTFSTSSYGSTSMNPSSSDYTTSNHSSSFTPQPSEVDTRAPFPFAIVEDGAPAKRTPMRRSSKMNLLSKLFSGSKRDLKSSNKSVKGDGEDNRASCTESTMNTGSSATTLDLSRDAAQVFGRLRNKHQLKPPRNKLTRQKSEDSMIGSVLELPSNVRKALERTADSSKSPTTKNKSTRPPLPARATSVRNLPRQKEFVRAPTSRSVSFQTDRQPSALPSLLEQIPSSQIPTDQSPCSVSMEQTIPSQSSPVPVANAPSLQGHINIDRTPSPVPLKGATTASVQHDRSPSPMPLKRIQSQVKIEAKEELPSPIASKRIESSQFEVDGLPPPLPLERTPSQSSTTKVAARSNRSTGPLVEITPGDFQVLRGHKETLEYVRREQVASTVCLCCNDTIYAINDAALVVCPTCRSITPMQSSSSADSGSADGLALGFTTYEWFEVQREALNMP